MNRSFKKLYRLSGKCAKLQIKSLSKAESYFPKIDSEIKKLQESGEVFRLLCLNRLYELPIKTNGIEYFRPLFKMDTHRLIKEAGADDTNAVDFDVPLKTEIFSVDSGVVAAFQNKSELGGNDEKFVGFDNYLYIYNKERNLMFCYRHLEKFENIYQGKSIGKGELLGRVGMTGYLVTPHLHFVIYHFNSGSRISLKSLRIKFY